MSRNNRLKSPPSITKASNTNVVIYGGGKIAELPGIYSPLTHIIAQNRTRVTNELKTIYNDQKKNPCGTKNHAYIPKMKCRFNYI